MAQTDEILTGHSAPSNTRKQRLFDCYQRGIHLATCEKNYDYAHAMFAECVLNDPGNLQFVESMVRNLRARSPQPKKSLFKMGRGGSRTLTKALRAKDWSGVFHTGIELLKANPWDVATLRALAEACAALHHNEVELVYLKQALDAEPKNVDVNRHCARSLGRMGQFDQAIACWHRIEKMASKDEEATRMISTLAEEKFKYPGGRPPAAHREQTAAEIEKPEPAQPATDIVFSPEQKLEHAISEDPQNARNYLELSEFLLKSNRLNAAEVILSRGLVACGEQHALVEQLNQVRSLRAEEQRKLDEERAIEQQLANTPFRIPWMILALGSAMALLFLQIVPSAGIAARRIIDVRQWSQLGWIMFNIVVLGGLTAARFAPELRAIAVRRRIRRRQRATVGGGSGFSQ